MILPDLERAINAKPLDDTLRLVYSDALEEAGLTEEAAQQRQLAGLDSAITEWMQACQLLVNEFHGAHGFGPVPTLERAGGKRYLKINQVGNGNRVYAFLDLTNGDVLMPASWHKPAKHARGNLFDEHKGLSMMTWHGPGYLR